MMRPQLCTLGKALASLDRTADKNLVRVERQTVQLPINAVIGKVEASTHVSDNPTYQALTKSLSY
jgi:hypothetical protein